MSFSRFLTVLSLVAPPLAVLAGEDPQTLGRGQALYAEHCAGCHGPELKGEADWQSRNEDGTMRAPPHDDSGHTWHHGDRLLTDYVTLGGTAALAKRGIEGFASGMPAFGDVLTDDEVSAILTFIKAQWSERNRDFQRTVRDAEE